MRQLILVYVSTTKLLHKCYHTPSWWSAVATPPAQPSKSRRSPTRLWTSTTPLCMKYNTINLITIHFKWPSKIKYRLKSLFTFMSRKSRYILHCNLIAVCALTTESAQWLHTNWHIEIRTFFHAYKLEHP